MPDFYNKPAQLFSQYKSFTEVLPTMAALTLPNGKLKHVNGKMCDALGFSIAEFRSMASIYDISSSSINPKAKKIHTYCKRHESVTGITVNLLNKKGVTILAYLNFSIIRKSDKHVAYYLFTFQEIPRLAMPPRHMSCQDEKHHELENDINIIDHFTNPLILKHTRQIKTLIDEYQEQLKRTKETLSGAAKLIEAVKNQIDHMTQETSSMCAPHNPVNVCNLIQEIVNCEYFPIKDQVIIDKNLPNFVTNSNALRQAFQIVFNSLSAFPDTLQHRMLHIQGMEIGNYYGFLINANGYQDINDFYIVIARKIIHSQGGKMHLSSCPRNNSLRLMFTWPKAKL